MLPSYPPTEYWTGPPQQVHRLAVALLAAGEEVRVITTNGDGPRVLDVPAGRWIEFEGVPVFYGHRIQRAADFAWDAWRQISTAARSADVIHVTGNFSWMNLKAAAVARRTGVPVVVSPRGTLDPGALRFSPGKKALYFRLGGSRALAEAAAYHVTSDMERGYVEARYPGARIAWFPTASSCPRIRTSRGGRAPRPARG